MLRLSTDLSSMIHIGAEPTTSTIPTKGGLVRSVFAVAALGFWSTTAFLHLKFSFLIVTPMSTPFGPLRIADYASHVSWVAFVGLVIYLTMKSKSGHNRKVTFSCWAAWSLIVFGTNHFFISSANEYIHYPQYAILAGLMVPVFDRERTGVGIAPILFWATVLGIVDEMNQYVYLCPQYGEYLDFNDFFLNELGAMAGILLLYGFRESRPSPLADSPLWRTKEARVTVVIVCVVLFLFLSGRVEVSAPFDLPPGGVHRVEGSLKLFLERKPGVYGSWQKANPSGFYYVMGPLSGMVLLFSAGAAFLLFDERRRTKRVRSFRSLVITARDGTVKRLTRKGGDLL
jgi:glycopeptide antibiotics resistance protein